MQLGSRLLSVNKWESCRVPRLFISFMDLVGHPLSGMRYFIIQYSILVPGVACQVRCWAIRWAKIGRRSYDSKWLMARPLAHLIDVLAATAACFALIRITESATLRCAARVDDVEAQTRRCDVSQRALGSEIEEICGPPAGSLCFLCDRGAARAQPQLAAHEQSYSMSSLPQEPFWRRESPSRGARERLSDWSNAGAWKLNLKLSPRAREHSRARRVRLRGWRHADSVRRRLESEVVQCSVEAVACRESESLVGSSESESASGVGSRQWAVSDALLIGRACRRPPRVIARWSLS